MLLWWRRALGASSIFIALRAMRHAPCPRGRAAIHRCLLGDSIGRTQQGIKHTLVSVKPMIVFVTEYRTAIKESVLLLARGAKQIRASLFAKEEAIAVGVDESTARLASHRSVVDALSTGFASSSELLTVNSIQSRGSEIVQGVTVRTTIVVVRVKVSRTKQSSTASIASMHAVVTIM